MRLNPAASRSCLLAILLLCIVPARAGATPEAATGSQRIAAARDAVLPVVVSILTVRQDYRHGEPSLSVSSGSGTLVTAQGHIATNAHVTQNGKSFRVVFADGRELPAKLIGTDTLTDLAVLQVQPAKPETFAFAEFSKELNVKPGDTVLAMGAPWGLSNSMSAGVVNNPRRLLVSLFDDEAEYEDSLGDDEPTGRFYAWIQHDAAIAPGNSGGPLVDLSGRIVGVNTRGMIVGGDLAFAIPGPDADVVVRELIAHGTVKRATLGFRIRSLKGTKHGDGVLVHAVERNSAPGKAGLQVGDRILSMNGRPVRALQPVDVPAVQQQIAELAIGSDVKLQIDRDGKPLSITLTAKPLLKERGDEAAVASLGLSLVEVTNEMSEKRNLEAGNGLMVTGVRPGGPAAIARPEIQDGDIIRRIDGQPVVSLGELDRLIRPEQKDRAYVFDIVRNRAQRVALIKPQFGDRERTPLPELPKAWVGVEVQPITGSQAGELKLARGGYRVTRIYPGSPLGKAGARLGDLLVALDGEPLKPNNETSSEGFEDRVHDLSVGGAAKFSALRDGKPVEIAITVVAAPTETSGLRTLALSNLRAQLRELGFYDRVALRLPPERSGVFVDGVEGGGAAGLAHLRRNDVIIRLGDSPVRSPAELAAALARALAQTGDDLIPVHVIRGNQTRILYLDRYWLKADSLESP
jgi:serine protease Do